MKFSEKPVGKFFIAASSIAVGVFLGSLLVNALSVYVPTTLGGKKA